MWSCNGRHRYQYAVIVGLVLDVPEARTSQDLVYDGEVDGLAISSVKVTIGG